MTNRIASLMDSDSGTPGNESDVGEQLTPEAILRTAVDIDAETARLTPNEGFHNLIRQTINMMEDGRGFSDHKAASLPEVAQALGVKEVTIAVYPGFSERANYYDLYLSLSEGSYQFPLPSRKDLETQIPTVSAIPETRMFEDHPHAYTVRRRGGDRSDFGTNLTAQLGSALISRRVDDQTYLQPDGESEVRVATDEFFDLANLYIGYLRDTRAEDLNRRSEPQTPQPTT